MYQYSVAGDRTKQVVGGRSRLHLIDLGQLERADCKRGRVNIINIITVIIINYYYQGGLTVSGLASVVLSSLGGHKADQRAREAGLVGGVLRELLAAPSTHAAILAHVSPDPRHFSETLHTVQVNIYLDPPI